MNLTTTKSRMHRTLCPGAPSETGRPVPAALPNALINPSTRLMYRTRLFSQNHTVGLLHMNYSLIVSAIPAPPCLSALQQVGRPEDYCPPIKRMCPWRLPGMTRKFDNESKAGPFTAKLFCLIFPHVFVACSLLNYVIEL